MGAALFALGKLHEAPIYIDETGGLTPGNLRAEPAPGAPVRRQAGAVGDRLYPAYEHQPSGENRATEVSEISRSIKSLARSSRSPSSPSLAALAEG